MQVCWHFKKGLHWNCQGYFWKNYVKCRKQYKAPKNSIRKLTICIDNAGGNFSSKRKNVRALLFGTLEYILLRIKNDGNRKSLICTVNEWFLSICCSNLDRLWVKKPCNYWRVWLTLCSHSRNWSRNIIVNFFFARWPLTYQYNVQKGFCTHGVLRPNTEGPRLTRISGLEKNRVTQNSR